jgi:GT2 family glycosyltransferase
VTGVGSIPALSIIIVSYNGGEILGACLKSVESTLQEGLAEIILVDNGSVDGSPDMVAREFPRVLVLRNGRNFGFAAANNLGIARATGRFILLLNPDVIVHPHAIVNCMEFLQRSEGDAIVGCKTLFPDGRLQPTIGAFPSLLGAAIKALMINKLFGPEYVFAGRGPVRLDYTKTQPVDWVMGSFLMSPRTLLSTLGGLDERFFMYSEELDLCLRAHAAGFPTWYVADAVITHHWGGMSAVRRESLAWLYRSQVLLIQKHFSGWRCRVFLALLFVGVGLRVPVHFVLGCLTFSRDSLAKAGQFTYVLKAMWMPAGSAKVENG